MLVRSHIVVQEVGWLRTDDNEELDEKQRGKIKIIVTALSIIIIIIIIIIMIKIIIIIIVIIIVNEKERDTDYLRFQRDRAPPDVQFFRFRNSISC